jgi:hypothetical protein
MYCHTVLATFSLFLATAPAFFHSFSTASRCSLVTFFASPAFKLSSLARISALSVCRACTCASRSTVLSSELREERVPRKVLAVAVRWVVWLRRWVMEASRKASSSGVQEQAGSLKARCQ